MRRRDYSVTDKTDKKRGKIELNVQQNETNHDAIVTGR